MPVPGGLAAHRVSLNSMAYACCPITIMNEPSFFSQKCPSLNNEFCGHPTTQPIQYDGHKDYSENERLVAFLSQGFFF